MKITLHLFFLLTALNSFSQEDSTYIRQFLNKEIFPEVDTVYYSQKFKNGKMKERGWIVEETIGSNSKILTDTGKLDGYTGTYLLGEWKYYNSKREVIRIDSNSFVDGHFISIEYHYRRNGKLKYYYYSKVNYNHPDRAKISTGKIKDENHFGDFTTLIYNRKGALKRKYVWKDNVLILDEAY